MTAKQFMLEMELFEYSKDNFEMTKLMNQIELQEMALNARDAIKYNDLNEEALAYISETVEAANLKVEYFSEAKDDDEKEDGFFKKLWANIVKFWKWIWDSIAKLFTNLGNWIQKVFKTKEDEKDSIKDVLVKLKNGDITIAELTDPVKEQIIEFLKKHGVKVTAAGVVAATVGGGVALHKYRNGGANGNGNSLLDSLKNVFNRLFGNGADVDTDGPIDFGCSIDVDDVEKILDDIDKSLDRDLKIKSFDKKTLGSLVGEYDSLASQLKSARNQSPTLPKGFDKYESIGATAKECGRKCKEMIKLVDGEAALFAKGAKRIPFNHSDHQAAFTAMSQSLKTLQKEITFTIKLVTESARAVSGSHKAAAYLAKRLLKNNIA